MARHLWSDALVIPLVRSQHPLQIIPQMGVSTPIRTVKPSITLDLHPSLHDRGHPGIPKKTSNCKPCLGRNSCVLINACDSFQLMNVIYHFCSLVAWSGFVWSQRKELLWTSLAAKPGHRWKDTEFLANLRSMGRYMDKDKIISHCHLIRNTLKSYIFNPNLFSQKEVSCMRDVLYIKYDLGSTSEIVITYINL